MKTALLLRRVAAALVICASTARADVIMDWNGTADTLAVEQRQTPVNHSRTLALMHVAMFEAVNAIAQRYQPYRLQLVTDRNTSAELAAATAAHDVLVALFPPRKATIDELLVKAADGVPEGPARQRAILLGRKAASDLLALRSDDGSDAAESWRPTARPGVYIPTVIPVDSTVPGYKPWVMSSAAQFRPAPPPSLASEVWARDLAEIREVGGRDSKTRTPEQTDIARFWFLTGPRTFNPIVRQVAAARHMDLVDCARLYALSSMAAADAFIAVFDGKYACNFWRPVTAVRSADQAGSPATLRDASWLPLGETPMHPEYPCAHCIGAAAVSTVLIGIVGDDVGEITLTSSAAPGVTRRWSRLSEYRDEIANARIWAGFHYRFSTEVGKNMGTRIGTLTLATQLRKRG
jgi:hypothetical protein